MAERRSFQGYFISRGRWVEGGRWRGFCHLSPSQSFGLILVTVDGDWNQTSTKFPLGVQVTVRHHQRERVFSSSWLDHRTTLTPWGLLALREARVSVFMVNSCCGCWRHCPMAQWMFIKWRRGIRNKNARETCLKMIWDKDQYVSKWEAICGNTSFGGWGSVRFKLLLLTSPHFCPKTCKGLFRLQKIKWDNAYKVSTTKTDSLLIGW